MNRPAETPTQVVIVGGGQAGLGLAIELGQRGIRCILVERYSSPQQIPKGQNLTQRTLEHFYFWGAEPELRAARTIPRDYGIGGMTSYGTLLSGYKYDWLQRELVRPYYFTDNERLPQYATEAVLRHRLSQLQSVETLYGWGAAGIEQDADGVQVTIAGRNSDRRRTLRADYVVGCDGSRSLVRDAAGITQTLSDHDRLMVLLVFRSTGLHRLLERFPNKSFYNVLRSSSRLPAASGSRSSTRSISTSRRIHRASPVSIRCLCWNRPTSGCCSIPTCLLCRNTPSALKPSTGSRSTSIR